MYVCGPTVYDFAHIGNARPAIVFDALFRLLRHLFGAKHVTYVRNITDVDDKINARALRDHPGMELNAAIRKVTETTANQYFADVRALGCLDPTVQPRATEHIKGMVEMISVLMNRGHAYVAAGEVLFDVGSMPDYGKLSQRKLEDQQAGARIAVEAHKKNPADFVLWKLSAAEEPGWESPWGRGRPGWHIECSVMSKSHLGEVFDIHGGGLDLIFPHHENEIAQNFGSCHCKGARYWMHTNMLLLNGKKMSKSDGNTISPPELFAGDSEHVSKGYSPMVVRFFMLQTHYRSTLDLTDEALQAAEKGFRRLMDADKTLQSLQPDAAAVAGPLDVELNSLMDGVYEEMDDDFNTPKTLARIFELVSRINGLKGGQLSLSDVSADTLTRLKQVFHDFVFVVFGLLDEDAADSNDGTLDGLMQLIIDIRSDARVRKDWATSDKIRDALKAIHLQLKDGKEGTSWGRE